MGFRTDRNRLLRSPFNDLRAEKRGTQQPRTILPQGAGTGLDSDTVDGRQFADAALPVATPVGFVALPGAEAAVLTTVGSGLAGTATPYWRFSDAVATGITTSIVVPRGTLRIEAAFLFFLSSVSGNVVFKIAVVATGPGVNPSIPVALTNFIISVGASATMQEADLSGAFSGVDVANARLIRVMLMRDPADVSDTMVGDIDVSGLEMRWL